ncbi:MAG: hypothetical protein QOK40_1612 [Miltoncostaeaceae bacterium]|nr:hypothetical protein [Miltoncostaeaceae bacterium]
MKAVRSRTSARTLGVTLAVGASLALPAAALAVGGGSAASVKAHVNGSQAALKLAVKLSASGQLDKSFAAFLESRTELGKARAGVIGLLKGALTPLARADAARALALLGKLEDANISKLTALLDDVAGPFQKAVAKANLNDTAARDRAIGILQALLPGLPGVVQGPISSVIGSLMNGNGAQVQSQASLLGNVSLTPDVKKLVTKAIGSGLQGQAQSLVGIQSILGAVPGPAQQQLQSALQLARSQTQTAFDMVTGVMKTAPIPPAVSSLVSGILHQMQGILDGVLGMFGPAAGPATGPAAAPVGGIVPGGLIPDLGGIIKCVFPSGLPTGGLFAGGALPAGLDPSKIAGCLTSGGGLPDPTGIMKCVFPAGLPAGGALPAGFDPSAIASCVLKSVPDPMGILKNLPDPSGILTCVFPGGLPNPASLAGGALPAGFDPTKIAGCIMGGGSTLDPTGIMKCVFPGGAPTAGILGGGILPAGFDPFKIAGCVMQSVPFIGGGLMPNPMQLVSSFMPGGLNPFDLLGGLFGGGSNGGGFLGGLLPF